MNGHPYYVTKQVKLLPLMYRILRILSIPARTTQPSLSSSEGKPITTSYKQHVSIGNKYAKV